MLSLHTAWKLEQARRELVEEMLDRATKVIAAMDREHKAFERTANTNLGEALLANVNLRKEKGDLRRQNADLTHDLLHTQERLNDALAALDYLADVYGNLYEHHIGRDRDDSYAYSEAINVLNGEHLAVTIRARYDQSFEGRIADESIRERYRDAADQTAGAEGRGNSPDFGDGRSAPYAQGPDVLRRSA